MGLYVAGRQGWLQDLRYISSLLEAIIVVLLWPAILAGSLPLTVRAGEGNRTKTAIFDAHPSCDLRPYLEESLASLNPMGGANGWRDRWRDRWRSSRDEWAKWVGIR